MSAVDRMMFAGLPYTAFPDAVLSQLAVVAGLLTPLSRAPRARDVADAHSSRLFV